MGTGAVESFQIRDGFGRRKGGLESKGWEAGILNWLRKSKTRREYEFQIEQALSDIVKIEIESNKLGFYNKQETTIKNCQEQEG